MWQQLASGAAHPGAGLLAKEQKSLWVLLQHTNKNGPLIVEKNTLSVEVHF